MELLVNLYKGNVLEKEQVPSNYFVVSRKVCKRFYSTSRKMKCTNIGENWVAILLLLLLAISNQVQAASSNSTSANRPSLQTTTSKSQSATLSTLISSSASAGVFQNSTSSTSSYVPTFTPEVPITSGNRFIYQDKHTGGTVFIAVGSCLGFVLMIVTVAWIAFALSSWYSARKEYKLKEMENKYQYDPFYFNHMSDFNESNDSSYSDGDDNSDLSEKILKNKSSRLTLHTVGSGSVLNLLNFDNKVNDTGDTKNKSTPNNRQSMFISPTEILQNEVGNPSSVWNDSNTNASGFFNSADSTPKEQTHAQFINNPSMSNLTSNAHWKQLIGSKENLQNNASLLRADLVNSPPYSVDSINESSLRPEALSSKNKKSYRPPSMHLDDLLDGNDDT